jgi:hypothetical protein
LEARIAALRSAQVQISAEKDLLAKELKQLSHLVVTFSDKLTARQKHNDYKSTSMSRGCQTEVITDDDDCFYTARGAWEVIISFTLSKPGPVDVSEAIVRLSRMARDHVPRPMFTKTDIMEAIQSCAIQGL